VNIANVVIPIQVETWTASALEPGMRIGIVERGDDAKTSRTFFLSGSISLRAFASEPGTTKRVILFLEIPTTELKTFTQLPLGVESLTPFQIQTSSSPLPLTPPIFGAIHFDSNGTAIRPREAEILDEDADMMKQQQNLRVYLDGFCDASGRTNYNLELSRRRAVSVAKYLEVQGIPAAQLIPRSFGKTSFVAPNDTKEGRAKNRRVELNTVEGIK
jgi:hypothetical protein